MSDSKEFNEANEQELEQVAGGDREILSKDFYCPNCGRADTMPYFKGTECPTPVCLECDMQGLGRFRMIPV